MKTLDNFASNQVTINECKGSFPLSKRTLLTVQKGDVASANAIRNAVAAIPPNLQKLFFEADGGYIIATKDFQKSCAFSATGFGKKEQQFFQGGLPELSACTRLSVEDRSIILQFKPDAKSIAHQLVRVFGLNYGRIYGPRRFKDWDSILARLAVTFVREVALSEGKFSLQKYEAMFSTDAGLEMFFQFVFGEAFDSFYCNNSTRSKFAKDFPETFLNFQKIAKAIEGRSGK